MYTIYTIYYVYTICTMYIIYIKFITCTLSITYTEIRWRPQYTLERADYIWILFVKTVMAIYNMVGKIWSLKTHPMSHVQVHGTRIINLRENHRVLQT